ncbi:hypothetical protein MMC14_007477 [Varicellaria rhodocarpa]|nr:hypothetical protein [Varicellaria rhodocarpa]
MYHRLSPDPFNSVGIAIGYLHRGYSRAPTSQHVTNSLGNERDVYRRAIKTSSSRNQEKGSGGDKNAKISARRPPHKKMIEILSWIEIRDFLRSLPNAAANSPKSRLRIHLIDTSSRRLGRIRGNSIAEKVETIEIRAVETYGHRGKLQMRPTLTNSLKLCKYHNTIFSPKLKV